MPNNSDSDPSDSEQQSTTASRLDPRIWPGMDSLVAAALRISGRTMEPVVWVQQAFAGMWPSTPREVFTEVIPPSVAPYDEITIDMMGAYYPDSREIRIYTKLIEKFCDRYTLDRGHVELVVRVHEYAHALVHLGVLDNTCFDDEAVFLSGRRSLFDTIGSATHELLAQSITWVIFRDKPAIRGTLETMLLHQPIEYDLSPRLKQNLSSEVLRSFISLLHSQNYFSEADLKNAMGIRAAFEQPAGSPPDDRS